MGARIKYQKGQTIGKLGLVFIEEITPIIYPYGKKRMGVFQCICGKSFKASMCSVASGHTNSCGCYHKEELSRREKTHGKSTEKLYRIWVNIKSRCLNRKDKNYSRYGGRGIKLFSIWQVDFQSFYDYVSLLPNFGTKDYSLDRIENNEGYYPGNLRWTNQHFQVVNSRKKHNKSGYTGVHPARKKWYAEITVYGVTHFFKGFNTPNQAVTARNNYIIANKLFEYKIQPIKSQDDAVQIRCTKT